MGLCGFKRINQNIVNIIEEIKKIDNVDKTKIILFPQKEKSIEFAQVFVITFEGRRLSSSKFSQVFNSGDGCTYILFNLDLVEPHEIPFLFELVYLKQSKIQPLLEKNRNHLEFRNLIENCLSIYNHRMGINFVKSGEYENKLSEAMITNIISSYCEYDIYKQLSEKYSYELLNYLHDHKLDIDHLKFMKMIQESKVCYVSDLFNIISNLIELKAIELSISNQKYHERISKKVKNYTDEIISQLNEEITVKILYKFVNEIDGEKFSDYPNYMEFIKFWHEKIFNEIPMIFIRYEEATYLLEEQINLIQEEQEEIFINASSRIGNIVMPKYAEFVQYIIKLDKILQNDIPVQIKLILLHSKINILHEFITRIEDEDFLKVIENNLKEFSTLLIENYSILQEDPISSNIKKWDIILHNTGLVELYYRFNKIDKFIETIEKNRKLLYEYDAPFGLKISTLSLHFGTFEDYDDLSEINKLFYMSDFYEFSNEGLPPQDSALEAVCKFSSYIPLHNF